MSKRAYIPYPQQLAAALRELGGIPYTHAKQMTASQVISLFERHHGIYHGVESINDHWNITWLLRSVHKARFKKDNAEVKKVGRIEKKWREFTRDMKPDRPASAAKSQPPSRWPQNRKLQSRNDLRRRK